NNFLGMAGPGVRHTGLEGKVFSDHTDIRPTMLALLGMTDDYVSDGRVLVEKLDNHARGAVLHGDHETYERLARLYKQINAPVGELGLRTLRLATVAIMGDDAGYGAWLASIGALTADRNALVSDIKSALSGAVFGTTSLHGRDAQQLIKRAKALLGQD